MVDINSLYVGQKLILNEKAYVYGHPLDRAVGKVITVQKIRSSSDGERKVVVSEERYGGCAVWAAIELDYLIDTPEIDTSNYTNNLALLFS